MMLSLHAKSRLCAFEKNLIRKTKGFDVRDHATKADAKNIGTLAGYTLFAWNTPHSTVYTLKDGEVDLAILVLNTSKKDTSVSYSAVRPSYVGKGVGFLLYDFALNKHRVLTSDDSLSVGASITWARLIKKHRGAIIIPAFRPSYPEYTVAIHGWTTDKGGVVWPLVKSGGKIVPVTSLDKTQDQRDALALFFYKVYK